MTDERRFGYGLDGQPLAPTSLDPLETSYPTEYIVPALRPWHDTDEDRRFIHSGWATRRRLIYRALETSKLPWRRLWAFRHCGGEAWIQRSNEEPPRYRVQASWCRDRWCAVCATRRGNTIAARILNDRDPHNLRFLTLTLRILPRGEAQPGEAGSLKYALDRLYSCFRRLRGLALWKDAVTGGAAFTEVKWSHNSLGWHAHIHAILEGRYIPHPKLKEAWHRITGDSHVVDIRKVRTTSNAVNYVTRYVTKAWDRATERNPNLLAEAVVALGSRRMVNTFGTWRGLRLTAKPSGVEWESVFPLSTLRDRMEAGDPNAYQIWHALNVARGFVPLAEAATDAYDDT